jgi:hypothetical protein
MGGLVLSTSLSDCDGVSTRRFRLYRATALCIRELPAAGGVFLSTHALVAPERDSVEAETNRAYLRRKAEECLARARTAATESERALWSDLANLWLARARQVE